jgi:hypothetical protein
MRRLLRRNGSQTRVMKLQGPRGIEWFIGRLGQPRLCGCLSAGEMRHHSLGQPGQVVSAKSLAPVGLLG